MTKSENVTTEIPANFLRLLEEKEYFGKTKEEWFINCVNQGVDVELNKLYDRKEVRRLEKKYNLEYLEPSFTRPFAVSVPKP